MKSHSEGKPNREATRHFSTTYQIKKSDARTGLSTVSN
ncbi:Hypothetical protein ADU71_1106 [Pediococcus damnosus]|nr:Hypothetical protein ADU69_1029 [Pediococcus damnosus]AMV65004.1 Hypothetical protein ADU71_1106 [Pediococcus damnosus]